MDGQSPEGGKITYEQAKAARRRQLDIAQNPLTTRTTTVGPPVRRTVDNPAGLGQVIETTQRGSEVTTIEVRPAQPVVAPVAPQPEATKKWWQFWKK